MPQDQRNHDLVVDAIAATQFADTLAAMDAPWSERRLAELEARRQHLHVDHLQINHGMNHAAQAARHQARYAALKGR